MDEERLTDIIEDWLDGMRLIILCVAGVREFENKQRSLARALAQWILEREESG